MTKLKDRMIRKVLAKGGKPTGTKSSLDECFTYDNQMRLLVLWYNIGNNTKIMTQECGPKDADFLLP